MLYFAALVLGRESTGDGGWFAGAVFALAVFVASASWQVILAGGGSALGTVLNTPLGRLLTSCAAGAVIVTLAVRVVSSQ